MEKELRKESEEKAKEENIEIQSTKEFRLTSSNSIKWENVILTICLLAIYLGTWIYGITQLCNPVFVTKSQAVLIVLQCTGGLVLSIAPDLLEKWFKIKLSFAVRFGIELFGLMGIVLGEGLQFYHNYSWWDDMLHFTSGFGVAFLGYCVVANLIKNNSATHKVAICVIASIAISFSVGFIWEIFEFSMDNIFGTDMQKSITEYGDLYNGGSILANLNGTDEEIADYFRTPEGYRFALMDTMGDLVNCFIGTALFQFTALFIRIKHAHAFDNQIEFNYKGPNKVIQSSENL